MRLIGAAVAVLVGMSAQGAAAEPRLDLAIRMTAVPPLRCAVNLQLRNGLHATLDQIKLVASLHDKPGNTLAVVELAAAWIDAGLAGSAGALAPVDCDSVYTVRLRAVPTCIVAGGSLPNCLDFAVPAREIAPNIAFTK